MIDPEKSVASLVLERSECASVLQRHRIDYCCRGELSLRAACERVGMDLAALTAELERAIAERRGPAGPDPRALSPSELVEYIVERHHEYLREALPFVQALAAKVSRVHGDSEPRLRALDGEVQSLASTLLPHLDEEESTLFPALTAQAVDAGAARRELGKMKEEHLAVGDLLARIRTTTEDFRTPEWACNSYRTLFAELEQLEGDVLRHVHLENHVLMPRFVAA
ncbi:MAG: iron-sulfur cluster repair di-iron protein [Polyangiaceae bacterium]|nr:iron-sulfur cluster repair di-iron protein [Polyangiaceae bacterium]